MLANPTGYQANLWYPSGFQGRGDPVIKPTTDPLFGIRLKLERAYEQLKALHGEMAVFLQGDAYEPAVKFSRKSLPSAPKLIVDFEIRMIVKKPCPPHWSVI